MLTKHISTFRQNEYNIKIKSRIILKHLMFELAKSFACKIQDLHIKITNQIQASNV